MSQKKRKRQQPSNPLPLVMLGLGALLLVVALVLLLSRTQPTGTAQISEADVAAVQRVTQAEAKAAFDAGQAVFLDVRGPAGYNAGHMPGAILMTMDEMETRWTELDPNDWIITYCT